MARKSKSTQPNVGAWLGGNRGYVQSGSNTDTSAKIDAGGGQMEQVRAELGLGAYVAGVGATAAIGAGIAAAKTPVGRRAVNKFTKQEVLLHGRKTAGYSEIKPMGGKYEGLPESERMYAVAWYDNPQVARDFNLAKSYGFSSPEKLGTVYAVRGKAKTFTQGDYVSPANFKTDLIVQSPKNQKVVGSVNLTGNTSADDAAIAKMLKKAGGTVPLAMRKARGGGKNKK